ncbi:MAG: twitching motility protein PilT, partial [Arenicellales bacterium]
AQRLLKKPGGGRVAAYEIMIGTPAIRNLIREAKIPQIYGMIQTGKEAGMTTMDQSLEDLVNRGVVERSVARSLAVDQSKFS